MPTRRTAPRSHRRSLARVAVVSTASALAVALLAACSGSAAEPGGAQEPDARGDGSSSGTAFAPAGEAPALSVDGDGILAAFAAGDLDRDEIATATLADAGWVQRAADATGIPARAVAAYTGAAAVMSIVDPGCAIGWTTIAGVGAVESRHGTIFGDEIADDGQTTAPIYGPRLDGDRFERIDDHDGGAIDGDAGVDRAVGPMQIIPATWMAWGVDASGAGDDASPHDIDDASYSAARYLCHSAGDDGFASEAGWRAGIAGYNGAASYAAKVADAANEYLAALSSP